MYCFLKCSHQIFQITADAEELLVFEGWRHTPRVGPVWSLLVRLIWAATWRCHRWPGLRLKCKNQRYHPHPLSPCGTLTRDLWPLAGEWLTENTQSPHFRSDIFTYVASLLFSYIDIVFENREPSLVPNWSWWNHWCLSFHTELLNADSAAPDDIAPPRHGAVVPALSSFRAHLARLPVISRASAARTAE